MSIRNIAALVSIGQHSVSGEPRHCQNDSLAMTMGLNLASSLAIHCDVLHVGDAHNAASMQALREYLALGATQVDVIPATNDTQIVDALAANLNQCDLILTGSRTESGQGSGLLPYQLAATLGVPLVANALAIQAAENSLNNSVEVLQFLPKGKRRRVTVQCPAVIVIHPLAPVPLRFAYAKQVLGDIKQRAPTHAAAQAPTETPPTLALTRKPIKLKAKQPLSGHARMMSYIASESKGGAVVNNGDSVQKAQVILRYLREHQLINLSTFNKFETI